MTGVEAIEMRTDRPIRPGATQPHGLPRAVLLAMAGLEVQARKQLLAAFDEMRRRERWLEREIERLHGEVDQLRAGLRARRSLSAPAWLGRWNRWNPRASAPQPS